MLTRDTPNIYVADVDPVEHAAAALATAIEAILQCPITCDTMEDPVIAADGHTYSRPAIQSWLQKHQTSPMTNETLDTAQLIPNIALRQLIKMIVQSKTTEDTKS